MIVKRPLYCPVCGAKVIVEVNIDENGSFPEVHRIPDHMPATNVNLCQAVVVKVTLDHDVCSECGCKMAKHPTGKCMHCHDDFAGYVPHDVANTR